MFQTRDWNSGGVYIALIMGVISVGMLVGIVVGIVVRIVVGIVVRILGVILICERVEYIFT